MNISFEVKGLQDIIGTIKSYEKNLDSKINEFLKRLGDIGVYTADITFKTAQYDGVNDVVVDSPSIKGNTMQVIASGTTILFIEFGTGIVYTEQHPKANELNMTRGSYGQGKGNQRTWGYYGEPGTNGVIEREVEGKGTLIKTHGNPPAKAMYEASKDMQANIIKIAEEVFKFDRH